MRSSPPPNAGSMCPPDDIGVDLGFDLSLLAAPATAFMQAVNATMAAMVGMTIVPTPDITVDVDPNDPSRMIVKVPLQQITYVQRFVL